MTFEFDIEKNDEDKYTVFIDHEGFYPYNGGINVWCRLNNVIKLYFEHHDRIQIKHIRLVNFDGKER